MSDQQEQVLVDQGHSAEQLLQSEVFSSTVNNLVDACFQQFVNTKPEDSTSRETAYNHYRALVDIINTLKQKVSVKDEIMSKNEEKHDNSETEG